MKSAPLARQSSWAMGESTFRPEPAALMRRNWPVRVRSARITSARARPWASSTAKSAMATGYWVAPVPEISTRNCAWAGLMAIRQASASSNRPNPYDRQRTRGEARRLWAGVIISNLLSIIHSVHNVNDGLVAAGRRLGEGVATADAGLDSAVEARVAGGTGQRDPVNLPVRT